MACEGTCTWSTWCKVRQILICLSAKCLSATLCVPTPMFPKPGLRREHTLTNWTTFFFRIALAGAQNCESQVWGDSRESLAPYEHRGLSANRFARMSRFALRIARPSKQKTIGLNFRPLAWPSLLWPWCVVESTCSQEDGTWSAILSVASALGD